LVYEERQLAGDWIKMRSDLQDDPAVFRLASMLKVDRYSVVGRLHAFWSWADKHAIDGYVTGAALHLVDEVVTLKGFADAMVVVQWLEVDGDRGLRIPRHERHNGPSAKTRGLTNQRQKAFRERNAPVTQTSRLSVTREEKRREVKEGPDGPSITDPIWGHGLSLLTGVGVGEVEARRFLGRLLSEWEVPDVAKALLAADGKADPRAYVRGCLKDVPKKRKPPPGTEGVLASLRAAHGDAVTLASDGKSFWHPQLQTRWTLDGEKLASL
jgi:hypothetical protein